VFIVGNGSPEPETTTPTQDPEKTPTATPTTTPIPPTPTATDTPMPSQNQPENAITGKVCALGFGKDPDTFYLRAAEFNNLDFSHAQPGVKASVTITDTAKTLNNVTLDRGTHTSTCVAEMSDDLLAAMGIYPDVTIELADRLERHFIIREVPIEIKITNPLNGANVGANIPNPAGTYIGIPPDRTLWLVVFVDGNFYPQRGPATILSDTEWLYGTIFFGGENLGFSVMAVLADDEAGEVLRNHTDGLPIPNELPVGAIVYDVVDVFRVQ
jgi:hypothetical protein